MKMFEVSRRFGAFSGFSYNMRYGLSGAVIVGEERFCCGIIYGVC